MAVTELLNTLYVQTQGAALFLDHDSVRLTAPGVTGHQALPLRRLDAIIAYGHVSISPDLLRRCAEDGRNVVWMSRSGRFIARVNGPVQGNVLLRHAQHLAYADLSRRLEIARCCVAGKIQNSRQMLLRSARDSAPGQQAELRQIADDLAAVLPSLPGISDLDELLGTEGHAARLYYKGFALLLRSAEGIPPFELRVKRPPTDPVNAVLSFFYGLLRTGIHGGAEEVGLDPYVGFLHAMRPGKPSLALDMMEEFNRRQLRTEHFDHLPGGAVRLTEDGRKLVLTEWQQSRQREWPHHLLGRTVPAALLPSIQARLLARHVRGELPSYLPWLVK